MQVNLPHQQPIKGREREGDDAQVCSISGGIQVRRATGVTGASGNDYQMGVIGFQAEGAWRSLDASEDSSQLRLSPS